MKENLIRASIEQNLKELEIANNIEILFAIENGSRAWNMASKNSDYDVRFVYKRKAQDYVSLLKQDDVIELYLDEDLKPCKSEGALLDIVGFDIMKYMTLLSKSNPTAIEWLMSDIVYMVSNDLKIKQYVQENFNPKTLVYHYMSLCKKHDYRYIRQNKKVTYKMYLYMMRGLLNALYVAKNQLVPPLDFTKTIELLRTDLPKEVYGELKSIIKIKSLGEEKSEVERIKELDDFIEQYENADFDVIERKLDIKNLNNYMQEEIFN